MQHRFDVCLFVCTYFGRRGVRHYHPLPAPVLVLVLVLAILNSRARDQKELFHRQMKSATLSSAARACTVAAW